MKATSFATRQDLARFCESVTRDLPKDSRILERALAIGDNGVGEWGDACWHLTAPRPIVALPLPYHQGDLITLTLPNRKPIICVCLDRSPAGVIDLSPSALVAAGYMPDADIDVSNVIVTPQK